MKFKFKSNLAKFGLIAAMFVGVGVLSTNSVFAVKQGRAELKNEKESEKSESGIVMKQSELDRIDNEIAEGRDFFNERCLGCAEKSENLESGIVMKKDDVGLADREVALENKVATERDFFNKYCLNCEDKPEVFAKAYTDENDELVETFIHLSPSLFYRNYLKGDDAFEKYSWDCLGFVVTDEETGKTFKAMPEVSKKSDRMLNEYVLDLSYDTLVLCVPADFGRVDGKYTVDIYKSGSGKDAEGEHIVSYGGVEFAPHKDLHNRREIMRMFAHPSEFDEEYVRINLNSCGYYN